MAKAYDAIIATIVVASDASSVTKDMVKSTQWRAGTSGTWLSTSCTLSAGNTYQFRTPLSGMSSSITAILPNIKASVTVDWDTSGTEITSFGNYFMSSYARDCSSLTSLDVPDTSNLTSVGYDFMEYYANNCSSLTSLSVPDTSGLTRVGDRFMRSYANNCSSLLRLELPKVGWFKTHNINWMVPSARLGYLKGLVKDPDDLADWKYLASASGRTLYTNYIQDPDNVILPPSKANFTTFFNQYL